MSKPYTLIGPEYPAQPWLITFEDVVPELPVITHHSRMISASRWPVLFYHQIPKRFLERDPGFPILLRQETNEVLPGWIYNPILKNTTDFKNRYTIETAECEGPENLLFLCYQSHQLDWHELTKKYPAKNHYWIWLGDGHEAECMLPAAQKLSLVQVIHFKTRVFDLVVDLDFGLSEAYGVIHLHCLSLGASLKGNPSQPQGNIKEQLVNTSCYGSKLVVYC